MPNFCNADDWRCHNFCRYDNHVRKPFVHSTQTNCKLGNINNFVGFSSLLIFLLCFFFDVPILLKSDFLATSLQVSFFLSLNVFVFDFLSQRERRKPPEWILGARSDICYYITHARLHNQVYLPSSPRSTRIPEAHTLPKKVPAHTPDTSPTQLPNCPSGRHSPWQSCLDWR